MEEVLNIPSLPRHGLHLAADTEFHRVISVQVSRVNDLAVNLYSAVSQSNSSISTTINVVTYSLNTPLQVLDEEWLNILFVHTTQLPNIGIVQ
jgi:hypothetical protein